MFRRKGPEPTASEGLEWEDDMQAVTAGLAMSELNSTPASPTAADPNTSSGSVTVDFTPVNSLATPVKTSVHSNGQVKVAAPATSTTNDTDSYLQIGGKDDEAPAAAAQSGSDEISAVDDAEATVRQLLGDRAAAAGIKPNQLDMTISDFLKLEGKEPALESAKRAVLKEVYDSTVAITTRMPRPGEIDGKHYRFLVVDTFMELRSKGELLEWGEHKGNYYGTQRVMVKDLKNKSK